MIIALFGVWGINKLNFDIGTVSVGEFPLGAYLPTILTILFFAGIAYAIYKKMLANILIGLGLLFYPSG